MAASILLLQSLACYLLLCAPPQVSSLTSFDFNFSAPGVLGSADIKYMSNASAAGDRIDLTKDTTWSTGRVAYGQPVRLWDDSSGMVASFTSNFTFAIRPHNSTTAQGDGMAFFVGPYPPALPQDSNGGFLGLVNNPSNPANTYLPPTVGVEFDAFRNNWDPANTVNHVGVDVDSVTSAAYAALPDGCFDGTMSARVRYDAGARALSVTLAFLDRPSLGLFNVSATVDFKDAGLPQDAAVGFSGATGDYVERHQILSWSFESTLVTTSVIVPKTSKKKKHAGVVAGVAAAASTGLAMLLLLVVAAAYHHLRSTRLGKRKKMSDDDEFEQGSTGPRRFTYRQLSQATKGFSGDAKLGEGGFGAVYRGFLPDMGLHVAVKRVSKTSRQGRREYISEVTIISRLRHRNLVQLVGWCHEADELLLVYDLMPNGSLEDHLYSSSALLTWPVRRNVILGMGSALLYLHQEWEQCVVHRDIKPASSTTAAPPTPRCSPAPRATWTRSPWRPAAPAPPPTCTASGSSSSRPSADASPSRRRRRTRERCCSCTGCGASTGAAGSSTPWTRGCCAAATKAS